MSAPVTAQRLQVGRNSQPNSVYSPPCDFRPTHNPPFITPTPFLSPSSATIAIRPTSKRPLYKTHPGKCCRAQGNEAKLSSTSPPTQNNDKNYSLDALRDEMVSCDLPGSPPITGMCILFFQTFFIMWILNVCIHFTHNNDTQKNKIYETFQELYQDC